MNKPRVIALAATVVIAVGVIVLLFLTTLALDTKPKEWPPQHENEVTMLDEQYFDVVEDRPVVTPAKEEAAPVKNPEPAKNQSDPAPESGQHMKDVGPVGDAPSTVTSKRPSAVKKQKKEEPKQIGPTKEEIEAQKAAEARRKANSATASAFQRSTGKNNTDSKGKKEGDSGSPTGTSQSVSGTGSGTVSGGWSMPRYAKVPATVTGSIKLMVKIDATGAVKSVSFQGGDAPAATDARLRRAVEAEVRSRRFTRPNDDAPDQATAYITYRFK